MSSIAAKQEKNGKKKHWSVEEAMTKQKSVTLIWNVHRMSIAIDRKSHFLSNFIARHFATLSLCDRFWIDSIGMDIGGFFPFLLHIDGYSMFERVNGKCMVKCKQQTMCANAWIVRRKHFQ